MTATSSMRVISQDVLGGPEVLRLVEVDRPEPGLSEILVRVQTAIADLVTQGKLRPVIAGTFPLADAAKAHELGDSGHVAGKPVLTTS
jgi:NADPH:quinone reductase-like Zn-dependent oxidoreductase